MESINNETKLVYKSDKILPYKHDDIVKFHGTSFAECWDIGWECVVKNKLTITEMLEALTDYICRNLIDPTVIQLANQYREDTIE